MAQQKVLSWRAPNASGVTRYFASANELREAVAVPPGPRGLPMFGVAFQLKQDPTGFLSHAVKTYGDVVRLPMLGLSLTPMQPKRCVYVVNRPDLVKHICISQKKKYRPHEQLVDKLTQTLDLQAGELLTSVGHQWIERKALLQPSFNEKALANLGNKVFAGAHNWVSRLQRHPDNCVVDFATECTRFVTETFAQLFASIDLLGEHAHLRADWEYLLEGWSTRMAAPFQFMFRLPLPRNRRFNKARDTVKEALLGPIRERRSSGRHGNDLLSAWLQPHGVKDVRIPSDDSLVDQLMLLLLAGRRNVANALAWSCYLLAQHPQVAHRLHSEVDCQLHEPPLDVAGLRNMPYLKMLQMEVLRLYPTAWLIARTCLEEDRLDGYVIPRGATVFMSPFTLHRDARYWPDPERFDPERFADGKSAEMDCYMPFGKGPRTCIGNFLSGIVIQSALAMLVQRFDFALSPGQDVRIKATSSLHPAGGLPIVLRKRQAKESPCC